MIRTKSIQAQQQPYLTEVIDQKGRRITINSSRMESEYLSPSQLLQAGLAGCMSMTVKGALFRAGIPYEEVAVTVDMEARGEQYVFVYDIKVTSDADPALVERVKQEAAAGCYVRRILESGPIVEERR